MASSRSLRVWNLGNDDKRVDYLPFDSVQAKTTYISLGEIQLHLNATDTVHDVAAQFKEHTGLTLHQLKYRGNALHPFAKPWTFLPDLQDVSAPRFTLLSSRTPQLFVAYSGNERKPTVAVPFSSTDTIRDLKRKIESATGVPTARQQLTYAELCLNDEYSNLGAYGIQQGCTLQLARDWQLNIECSLAPFTLQVESEPSDTVASVKSKIESLLGVRVPLALSLGGVPLLDGSTLAECNVEEDSTLHMAFTSESYMQLHVKSLSGKTATLYAAPDETIDSIKQKYESKEGLPADQQQLIFAGKKLTDDSFTLSECGIQNGSSIHLVAMLKGGLPAWFADVSDTSALQVRQLNEDTRDWRATSSGINVEGYCRNAHCRATGKLVIHQVGMTSWPLIGGVCRCPLCYEDVVPETVGFVACVWKYDGRKLDGEETTSPFYDATTDGYHRFEGTTIVCLACCSLTVMLTQNVQWLQ
jgi:Ubiquitin family